MTLHGQYHSPPPRYTLAPRFALFRPLPPHQPVEMNPQPPLRFSHPPHGAYVASGAAFHGVRVRTSVAPKVVDHVHTYAK